MTVVGFTYQILPGERENVITFGLAERWVIAKQGCERNAVKDLALWLVQIAHLCYRICRDIPQMQLFMLIICTN